MSVKIKLDTKKLEKDLNNIIQKKNREIALKEEIKSRSGTMKILNETEKELLKIILNKVNDGYTCTITHNDLPEYISVQLGDMLSILKYAKYIARFDQYLGGCFITLTPEGINYFEKEDEYMKNNNTPSINIETLYANGSNINFGNVYDSNFNIDNAYNEIEKLIEEKGLEDKEELKQILLEVKDYIENITTLKTISKNSGLFTRIGNHVQKHQWFYQSITSMLGSAIIKVMSGA